MENLKEIGKLDYQESSFHAGELHMKGKAIEAFKIAMDKMYDSNFDQTIDYLKIFQENL